MLQDGFLLGGTQVGTCCNSTVDADIYRRRVIAVRSVWVIRIRIDEGIRVGFEAEQIMKLWFNSAACARGDQSCRLRSRSLFPGGLVAPSRLVASVAAV